MPSSALRKAAFIDRDGVLNDLVDRGEGFMIGGKPFRWTAPFHRREFRLKPQAQAALEIIERKGYLRILVTNQPDVATGRMPLEELEFMMGLVRELPLTATYVCMHVPKEGCLCRKPAPGMLLAARDAHLIDMAHSFMIGDLETDVLAGRAAGVHTIRVTDGQTVESAADHSVSDIMAAALLLP